MANPNIWAPGTAIDANSSVKFEAFTATASQTLFELNDFRYALGTGSLMVFVSGIAQRPGIDFFETSVSTFQLANPVSAGTIVLAIGFVEVSASIVITGTATYTEIATAGQTKFYIPNFTYVVGADNLRVFQNGVLQQVGIAYTETSSNSIQFSTTVEEDDVITMVALIG